MPRPFNRIFPVPDTISIGGSAALAFPDPSLASFRDDFIFWAEKVAGYTNAGAAVTPPGVGINVKDFGATGDGTTDDTSAINAALFHAYAAFNQGGTSGTINYNVRPTVYFPSGVYKISSFLQLTYAFEIVGYGAIIVQTDPTKDIFNAVNGTGFGLSGNAKFTIHRLILVGGKDQIHVDSNNVNNTVLNITDCMLINPVGSSLHTGPLHKGLTTVGGCFIWTNDSGGQVGQIDGGDDTVFQDSYVANHGGVNAFNVTGDVGLKLNNFIGTPGTASGGTMINVTGPSQIAIKRARFGGEQSMYAFDWRSSGGSIVADDLGGSFNSGLPNYRFFACPSLVDLRVSSAGGTGVWFDPAMPNADKRGFNELTFRAPGFGYPGLIQGGNYTIFDGGSDLFCLQQISCRTMVRPTNKLIQVADLIQGLKIESSMQSLYSSDSSSNNMGNTDGTNLFGASNLVYNANADNANLAIDSTNWLRNLPIGQYTIVVDWETDDAALIQLAATETGTQDTLPLIAGDPTVSHFYFSIGAANSGLGRFAVAISRLMNGKHVTLNRVRLYAGRVNVHDQRAVVIGAAAPTTGYWQPCDEVIYPVPVAGASPGLICTAAGFADGGNWATSTAYTRGQHRRANGATYICLKAGTSSNSGSGPNSSAYPVVDGTVEWGFLKTGSAPIWKAKAAIAA